MADLIAEGPHTDARWRRTLEADETYTIGRGEGPWQVPWDERISRKHVDVKYSQGALEVRRLESGRNPIFHNGAEFDRFELAVGDYFVIGETTFTLVEEVVDVSCEMREPVREQSFSREALRKVRYRDADHRLDVLTRVPEVIRGAASDRELYVRLINMLLAGIPRADAVALVAEDETDGGAGQGGEEKPIRVLSWDRRRASETDFRPSERLIRASLRDGESILHTWQALEESRQQAFTLVEDFDWAFSTPIPGAFGRGWAFYVTGSFGFDTHVSPTPTDPHDLRDDIKFCELVAATLNSLRQVRNLEGQNSVLRQFFSPVVVEAFAAHDADVVLAPRETEVTILFCDLRGFSREAERSGEDLLGLLERVSSALGVMTRHIRQQGGVVGDYQGDAAMGFWGWPLRQEDAVERACRAALDIRTEFEKAARTPDDPLAGFRMGIGIATGTAVAGKIGTDDQVKVTVFGPVVNLASRLEGMTKIFRAPILMDEATADYVRRNVPSSEARCRRVAVVRPYGLDAPVTTTELLPPVEDYPLLTDEHIGFYEQALDALQSGDWLQSFDLLHRVPPEDRVKDFLTVYIAQHNRTAPTNWNGVITMGSKS